MDFLSLKKVHIIGIGGIGVSAIARVFLARGAIVSGSDSVDFPDHVEFEEAGMKITIGHTSENISSSMDAVVFSGAIREDNPELIEAKRQAIPTFEYFEALGEIMKGRFGIAVSGTNGKTTTTALLGKMLEFAGMDPFVIVGGKVPGWNKNLRLSQERENQEKFGHRFFLVEGDEYRRHILKLRPYAIVLTNIEADHLDYYKDLEEIKDVFFEYISALGGGAILAYNLDDTNIVEIVKRLDPKAGIRLISFSLENDADLRADELMYERGSQVFRLRWQGENIGIFSFPFPGRFNVYNATAASAMALALEVLPKIIRPVLAEFPGTWRRFEQVGTFKNKIVISDYAHHPTAVKATLRAVSELYPDKKILTVFQPHQKDRTKKFFHEFASAFHEADMVILAEIYDVAGRDDSALKISSQDIMDEIKKNPKNPPVGFAGTLVEVERKVRDIGNLFDIILIMGAGDIYQVADRLVKKIV